MKFPRNARILRSQLDAAPLASVFFLLVIFVMLGSLMYTPGVHIELPTAGNDRATFGLPGAAGPTFTVALDASNRLFHANQLISEAELKSRLVKAVAAAPQPPTLVVLAHKAVTVENYTKLTLLAREAGIQKSVMGTLDRPAPSPKKQ